MTSTASTPAGRPLTHRDVDNTPDDGNRYEVIDGVLYASPLPFVAHQRVGTRLVTTISNHVDGRKLGEVFTSGLKVVLDEPTGVGPDVVYIPKEKVAGLREDGFHGAPGLVVEVISSRPALDRVVKFRKYAAAGVRHDWIVDPTGHTLEAYELEGGHDVERARLADDETFAPGLFPGLAIDLAALRS